MLITSIVTLFLIIKSSRWEFFSIFFGFINAFLILFFVILGLKIGYFIMKKRIDSKNIFLYSIYGIAPVILFAWLENIWPLFFIWMLGLIFIWTINDTRDNVISIKLLPPYCHPFIFNY